MMLVPNSVIRVRHRFDRQLPVRCRQGHQFAARKLFRRAAFIRINMRQFRTQHRMKRSRQRLQTQHVSRRPIENKEDGYIGSKLLSESSHRRFRVRIIPIPHHMPLVGAPYCLQHLGMHHRIVVARKTSARFHDPTI